MIKKISLLLFTVVMYSWAQAQNDKVEMADTMRGNGKIFVVVAVILTIFAGIILYLIRLDKKLTKLEKNSINS